MTDDWFESLKSKVIDFLEKATPEEIREALKKANYKLYTGIDPDTLQIKRQSEEIPGNMALSISASDDSYLKTLAWQNAWETRACPPDNILFQSKQSPQLKDHLLVCRLCRNKIESKPDIDVLNEFAKRLRSILPKPLTPKPKATQGQVWSLKRKLDGWGDDHRYYTSPMVLVVEPFKGKKGQLKVAQIYSEEALMDEGDVWLSDEFGFAESWNLYAIKSGDLDSCWGVVNNDLIKKVQEEAQNLKPFIPRHEIIPLFRNMEIDLGVFFSLKYVPVTVPKSAWIDILEGIKISVERTKGRFKESKEWLIDVSDTGLRELAELLLPKLEPARARSLKSKRSSREEEKKKLEELESNLPFLPVDFLPLPGNVLKIRWLKKKPSVEPEVLVTLRGDPVLRENVSWESWRSDTPVLVMKNCSVTVEEQEKAESLLSIKYADAVIYIDILSPNASIDNVT